MNELEDFGIKLLPGHRGEVNTCCLSPSHELVVTGGDDGQLYIWKAETCLLLCNLTGHSGPVNCCAFSPCGKKLVSGSYDATARIWTVGTPKCISILRGHSKSLEGLCYSHDGAMISTVSWDKKVIIWDANSGVELYRFLKHLDCVNTCTFSYNGKQLASGGWDNLVIVWKIPCRNKNELVPAYRRSDLNLGFDVLKGHTGKVSCLSFARVGILASGSWDRTVRLWNCKRRQLIATFQGHTGWVKALAFTIDSVELASAADDGSIRVWNIPKLRCVRELKSETDVAVMCNFSSNGILVSSGTAKESQIRELASNDDEHEDLIYNSDE